MKTSHTVRISTLLVTLGMLLPALAQEETPPKKTVEGWGTGLNPSKDCTFQVEADRLTITVPGSAMPHDLSAELGSTTAPRVLQSVKGDFTLQVKVDGAFQPGGESTEASRSGYTGAGLVVFADDQNFIRLERACLQFSGGQPHPYTNFEMRVDGQLNKIGTTKDFPTPVEKPLWLRLERTGSTVRGAMSPDGIEWTYGQPKELDAEIWTGKNLQVGVAAISTSKKPFTPQYSEFAIIQGAKAEAPLAEAAKPGPAKLLQTLICDIPNRCIQTAQDPAETVKRFNEMKISSTADIFAITGDANHRIMRPLARSVSFREVGAGASADDTKFGLELTDEQSKEIKAAHAKDELFIIRYIYAGKD
jgi:regulation of enolase protein 1 (concanavalin A-like superfamily)